MSDFFTPPIPFLQIVNQIFEMEKKMERKTEGKNFERHFRRIKTLLEEMEITYHNPLGEPYNETRTDVEASIAGSSTENLVIVEVIKPIIFNKKNNQILILQKGVVIVETR